MKAFKFIVSDIIGVIATLVLLAEIDINPLAFYAIKLSCVAVVYVCVRVMCEQQIIDLDD